MKRYELKRVVLFKDALECGKEGWKLITIDSLGYYVFQREITEKPIELPEVKEKPVEPKVVEPKQPKQPTKIVKNTKNKRKSTKR